jgi:hypothetical protein
MMENIHSEAYSESHWHIHESARLPLEHIGTVPCMKRKVDWPCVGLRTSALSLRNAWLSLRNAWLPLQLSKKYFFWIIRVYIQDEISDAARHHILQQLIIRDHSMPTNFACFFVRLQPHPETVDRIIMEVVSIERESVEFGLSALNHLSQMHYESNSFG